MDELERDYASVLLADREPPCLSLYQPTHRAYPERQQDPIRFRNLVKELEFSLKQQYANRDIAPILRPFQALAEDTPFWNYARDGLAVFAADDLFKVYRLQRPVHELAVVANSFHTKPLVRVLQSADRYHVLGLSRGEAKLYEGNRYALDEVALPQSFPQQAEEVIGEREGEPERKTRAYGRAGTGATTRHGTSTREDERDRDAERFFRSVDEAVTTQYSRPAGVPLILAALPENHHRFRSLSRNPALLADGLDVYPATLSSEDLRDRAWQIMLPHYVERLNIMVERFGAADANGLGARDAADIARASAAGRVATLLIESDRVIPGQFDRDSGAIQFAPLDNPRIDDLLDDLGEDTLRRGGEVIMVPRERMPTDTGLAAIFRF